MENIEVVLIIVILLAIVFKLIKILKYFIGIVILMVAFYLLGGLENESFRSFDDKYQISDTLSDWGDRIGVKGLISDLFAEIKETSEEGINGYLCDENNNVKNNIEDKFRGNAEDLNSKKNIECK